MKLVAKIASRVQRTLLIAVLTGTALVPMAGLITPASVHAAACNVVSGGGGGGGLLTVRATSPAADSTVDKIGYEITPQADWGNDVDVFSAAATFADSGCASNGASMYFTLDSSNKLTINYIDTNRVAAFVDATDYDNLFSGATFISSSNTDASVEYVATGLTASTPILVSIDLANVGSTGMIDVSLKIGSGTENVLISLLAPVDTSSYLFRNSTGYAINYGFFDDFGDCTGFTGTRSVDARMLFDSVAQDLSTESAGTCNSFALATFDSGTKKATLGYQTSGITVPHTIDLTDEGGAIKATTADTTINLNTSLELEANGKDFKNSFSSSTSASQQVYFTATEYVDGKKLPKDTPWPIASGTFDFSAGNVDLSAVEYDTSLDSFSALAHNLGAKTKDGSFTLYVPYRTGDKYVGVCAGAALLTAVSSKCTGIYYVKDGQTKTSKDTKSIPSGRSVKASVITVGAQKFWQVEGLTGTGVFSANIASDPETGISVSTTSTPVVIAIMILTVGTAVLARRAVLKK